MNNHSAANQSSINSPTSPPSTLQAVPPHERVFSTGAHASLWFSLGVGLLVMQVGAYLVPGLGLRDAMLAIAAGSLIGSGLLAWVAKIGCDSGLGSAALMHHVYGRKFARLPITLNLIQLIGWGTFELVVMREASLAITGMTGWSWSIGVTLLWGGVIALMISASMLTLVRRLIAKIALPLVVVSLLWLTWQFAGRANAMGWAQLWSQPGTGGMSAMRAIDLVIAMPISWLPLVADYARHGTSGRGAMRGTWIGFATANAWCYGLGVLIAMTMPSEDLVTALLLAQGGLIALGLILLDEIDNAYGDTYSGSLALHSLLPQWSIRQWGLLLTAVCTALALVLPMHSIEPFLLMLSSIFVPLFGVILGRLAWMPATVRAHRANGWIAEATAVHWQAVVLWLFGIAFYHALAMWMPDWGSALPTLVVTICASFITRTGTAGTSQKSSPSKLA